MSTTRSQKRRNNQQEGTESVSEGLVSPILVENVCHLNQDVSIAVLLDQNLPKLKIAFREFEGFFERGNSFRNQESSLRIPERDVEATEI